MASEFVMGARLEMSDNFSGTMSAATQATERFRQSANTTNQAVSTLTTNTGATSQATQEFADTLRETADAADSVRAPAQQATQSVNSWRNAMQQFDRGVEGLRNLPGTIRQIGAQRLSGLQNSFTNTRVQAGLLINNVQTLARTRVDSLVSRFREFSSTVSEGRSGLSGFATSLKNIAKISIANTYNTLKGMTSSIKSFASTKLTDVVNKMRNFRDQATGGETGVKGLWNALKKAASVSFSAVHGGLSKIGHLATEAGAKVTRGLGVAVTGITKGLMAATAAASAAVGAVMGGAIKVGKSFEAGMSTVAAISGATGKDLMALEEKAKQMGATTAFSATEAAKAMEYMAMAGWKTEQMVGGIDGIMNLASASGADLATTSDIVTDALTAFGMKAEESGRFADVLAAASSNANTNVQMMGATFKYVAPVAGALGYSVEDMGVAIGLMANAGIKGEMAGTQLRATLARMAKPTKESKAAMEALGLSITNSDGSMKEFNDVMVDMRKGMAGMTEDQKASYAAMLGGQEAMSGLLAIANASEEDFNKLTGAIDNSAGAAAKMAAIKLDNLDGDITILKSSLEGLGIEIYQGIQQPLRNVTQMATEMVGGLSKAFKAGGITGLVGEIGNVFATVVTKAADAAPSIIKAGIDLIDNLLTGIAKNAPQIAKGTSKAMTVFIGGIVDLFPRVVLVGADLILKFVQGIAKQLPQIVPQAIKAIENLITGLISNIDAVVLAGIDILNALISGLVQNLPLLLSAAMRLILSVVTGLLNNIQLIINCALNLVQALVTGLIQNIPLLLQGALQLIMGIVNGLVSNIQLIIDGAIALVNALVTGIVQNLPMIVQAAVQVVIALALGLIQAIPQLVAAVPQLVFGIIDVILSTDWIAVGWEIVKGIGKGLFDGIKGFFGGGEKGGQEAAQGAATGLTNNMETVSAASQATADTLTNGLKPDYTAINGYGAAASTSLAEGFTANSATAIEAASNSGLNAMTGLAQGFTANSTVAVDAASTTGLNVMTGLSTGLTNNMGLTNNAATEVTTDITNTFNDIDLFDSGKNAMEGLNNGLLSMKSTLMATARGMADSIRSEINSALDIHSPSRVMEESGEFTGEGLVLGINKMINKVREAARGLSDSTVEPFATSSASQNVISPTGSVATPTTKKDGLRIQIENIILSDVGNKDPKELVAEILKMLYEALSGADEVLSAGEMEALLT